jgi:hypothetical protein
VDRDSQSEIRKRFLGAQKSEASMDLEGSGEGEGQNQSHLH